MGKLDGRTLPFQPTRLIGRDAERERLTAWLRARETRLLTLTGPGGVGKTRLALAVAEEVAEQFPDGVFFVPLAMVTDPALVGAAIARSLGAVEEDDIPIAEAPARCVADRAVLLLLDNVEHLVDAAPALAGLLATCPNLTILATSRVPLRLRGERTFPVQPLAVPGSEFRVPSGGLSSSEPGARNWELIQQPERLLDYAAVRLFVERAADVRPDFTLAEENAATVAAICAGLDGMPLAIELAAARMRVLSPEAIFTRLHEQLTLLTGGPRDAPARHQTLRDTISWSHALLTPEEQTFFRRLAVFAGGFTLDAAAAIGAGRPPAQAGDARARAFDLITSLAEQSLIHTTPTPDGEPRFGMFETVREYAFEQLVAAGEVSEVQRWHAEFYLSLAQGRVSAADDVRGRGAWLTELSAEQDNLRAALAWCVEDRAVELGLRLVAALNLWFFRYDVGEGRRWGERLLALPGVVAPEVRAKALLGTAQLAYAQRDRDAARRLLEESVVILRGLEDGAIVLALALRTLAVVSPVDDPATRAIGEESVALLRGAGESFHLATALSTLGTILRGMGDRAAAQRCWEEASAIAQELGDSWLAARVQGNLADLALAAAPHADAAQTGVTFDAGLPVLYGPEDRRTSAVDREILARAAQRQGDHAQTVALLAKCLTDFQAVGDPNGVARCLHLMALSAAARGHPMRAARLFGTANDLREQHASGPARSLEVVWDAEAIESVRASMGERAFAQAWDEGRRLSVGAAIAAALEEYDEDQEKRDLLTASSSMPDGLTRRELEVLCMIAAGSSNREIAAALTISLNTVARHISNIFDKIGVTNRTEAAAYAHRHRLAS